MYIHIILFWQGSYYDINALIQSVHSEESSLSIICQVSLPFIIAGYGMVAAGMVLDIVQVGNVLFSPNVTK